MRNLLIAVLVVAGFVSTSASAEAALYNDRFVGLRYLPSNRVILIPERSVRERALPREDRCLDYDAYGKCGHEQRYYNPRTIRFRAYLQAEPSSVNPRMHERQGRCITDFNSRGQVVNQTCFDR